MYLDWNAVVALDGIMVYPGAMQWVTFESIRECIRTGHFEDVFKPHTEKSHHAARIASLVRYLCLGVKLEPLRLHESAHFIDIKDGSHRLRAYQYIGSLDLIPVSVEGNPKRVYDAGINAANYL